MLCHCKSWCDEIVSLLVVMMLRSNPLGWKDRTWTDKHPIKEMFNSGICCSINSDNQLLGGTLDRPPNTIEDIVHLVTELEFSWQDIKIILLNGVKSSFTKLDPNWIKSFERKIDEIIPVA